MSKVLIYSQEDLDLILELEKEKNEEIQQENKILKEKIDRAINYILKETKSMPVNGCFIRLKELQEILNKEDN